MLFFFLVKKYWYFFFLLLHKNICCGYSLEVPQDCVRGEMRKIFTYMCNTHSYQDLWWIIIIRMHPKMKHGEYSDKYFFFFYIHKKVYVMFLICSNSITSARQICWVFTTGSIAPSIPHLTADPEFELQLSHIIFMETDYEIISTVLLPLLLSQGGHLSVTGKNMYTSTG